MKRKILLLVCLSFSIPAFAQHEADNWYFGSYAGVSFSSGVPVALTNGQLYTNEGSAALSDSDGNLLFYSDGATIWDRTHTIMPNGTLLNSSSTCTQSALFVPYPGSDSLYYLFTPPDFVAPNFCYSIVDMSLNGGYGDIIDKNTVLFSPSAEKVTAVHNANGTDAWVIGHSFDNADFYVYSITTSGINPTPVISTAGTVQTGFLDKIGTMKASPCGDKIALVVFDAAYVELFDFDNTTGVVSNAIHLGNFTAGNAWGLYGLEFSPDGSRLYVTQEQPAVLVQYDLLAGSAAAIIASADTVAQLSSSELFGTLQNGPDGKTYIVRLSKQFLACINDPNTLGAGCNFVDNAVSLGSGYCNHGLPNFMSSFWCNGIINNPSSSAFVANDTDICEKFCIDFFDSSQNNPTSWLWEFPGGNPATSTDQNPMNICYNAPGVYDVTLITTNAGGSDTLTLSNYITVYTNPFAPVISQTGNTLTSTIATSYQWQLNSVDIPGATNQSYTITQSGLYTVIIGDDNGCTAQASVDASVVGIDDVDGNAFVNVYPNPSSGSFIVEWLNDLMVGEISINVVNTLGQEVFSSEESRSIGTSHFSEGVHSDKKEIDLGDVARGVYFIEIKTKNEFVRKKILIAE